MTAAPLTNSKKYTVRAVACDYRASDEEVYQALKRATDPLDRAWEKLSKAKHIAIKFNQDWVKERMVYYEGYRQQLVSDQVGRATLRLLREHTQADIFAIDVGVEGIWANVTDDSATQMMPVLREFNVPFIYGHKEPTVWVNVPGGGMMFERYPLPKSVAEADAVVSVQKIKNHAFMGVTLCLKNLFGLSALQPEGRPRHYYHHLVRMPYMLADLGRIMNPTLNILDGMVAQAGQEWGAGDNPRIGNTLVAGDQVIATDAVGTTLMGHDPRADWLTPPYHRDRNALLVATEGGFGTVDLDEIDYASEVKAPIAEFFTKEWDTREMVISWRKTTAEQGAYYRDHRADFAKYTGQYILLQQGEVRWSDPQGIVRASRRVLSGDHPEQGMWMKYVEPEDSECEHFEVYDQTLADIKAKGLA